MFVSLSVCLSVYLSVCLSVCLFVCLSVWLFVCLFALVRMYSSQTRLHVVQPHENIQTRSLSVQLVTNLIARPVVAYLCVVAELTFMLTVSDAAGDCR